MQVGMEHDGRFPGLAGYRTEWERSQRGRGAGSGVQAGAGRPVVLPAGRPGGACRWPGPGSILPRTADRAAWSTATRALTGPVSRTSPPQAGAGPGADGAGRRPVPRPGPVRPAGEIMLISGTGDHLVQPAAELRFRRILQSVTCESTASDRGGPRDEVRVSAHSAPAGMRSIPVRSGCLPPARDARGTLTVEARSVWRHFRRRS